MSRSRVSRAFRAWQPDPRGSRVFGRGGECSLTALSFFPRFHQTPTLILPTLSPPHCSLLFSLSSPLYLHISLLLRARSLRFAPEHAIRFIMSSRKRKSTEASPASSTRTTPSTTRPSRIKPSVEFVEVSSDNNDENTYKAGPERGLSRGNRLDASSQQSVERIDDDEDAITKSRHMTRGSRHGRADNRICYNMKCKQALFPTRWCPEG